MSAPDPSERLTVPSRTTPTWEIELLISAAVVFALFQCLEPLELSFAKWMALAPADREMLVLYGYLYGKLVLFVLITTFVLHIAARAAWVALVGVHSIFPAGPRWENLSGGPLARRCAEILAGDIDAAVERADNRASLVFGYGILTAQFGIAILVISLLTVLLAWLLSLWISEFAALSLTVAVLVVPITLAGLIDKWWGKRLDPNGRLARTLESTLRLGSLLTLGRLTQPLLPLVTTNVGGRRGLWLLMGVLYLLLAISFIDTLGRLGRWSPLRGDSLPQPDRNYGISALHYQSLRSDLQRHVEAPYIPGEVVEGPYLRLFVPYSSDRHDAAMANTCGPAWQARAQLEQHELDRQDADDVLGHAAAQAENSAALMRCFADLLQIRLDGQPPPDLQLEAIRDPYSGHDGGVAMIDVRALPAGRHQLELQRLPLPARGFKRSQDAAVPADRILFWR